MIDITPKHLETIQHILTEHVPECEVRAFGSRVKWTAKDYSDLDLAVVGSEPLSLRQLRRLKEAFEESNLPIRVDVVDWQSLSDGFKQVIQKEYEVIQKVESAKDSRGTRKIHERYSLAPDELLLKTMPLGPPPNDWAAIRLTDAVDFISTGATPRGGQKVYQSDGISLIRSQNVYDHEFNPDGLAYIDDSAAHKLRRVNVQKNDVLLNITGDSIARCCVVPEWTLPARVNQHVAIIRTSDKLNSIFLQKYLSLPPVKAYMLGHDSGGTRKALTKAHIESFLVPLPPLSEQRWIADLLSTFDEKIELNRQMNETLEAMAQAIFKSWFVDFDPVRAKMEGRMPAGMDAATATLFPSAFQDSSLGKIPGGWEVTTVGEEFNLTMGQSPPGSTYNEDGDGMPFYQGRKDFGFRYPTRRVYCNAPTRLAKKDDTLVSVRAPVGDINMVEEKCCIGRGIAAIRHKTGSRSYTYYAMQFLREDFSLYEAEGTVFGAINKTGFQTLSQLRPSDGIIEAFERLVYPLDQSIENNENQSRTLSQIRDALLPKLLSGEIRVDNVDKRLEVKDGGTS